MDEPKSKAKASSKSLDKKPIATKPATKPDPIKSTPKPSTQKHGVTTAIAVFSFIIAIAAIVGLLYLWRTTTNTQQTMVMAIHQLQLNSGALLQQQSNQQQSINAAQKGIKQLQRLSGLSSEDWVLAESEYLIRLANININLNHNKHLAVQFLSAADARLRMLDDPDLTAVRRTIAQNLAALNAASSVDVTGITLKLNAIANELATLPLTPAMLSITQAATPTASQAESKWRYYLDKSLNNLKDIIVIRHSAQPINELITPMQQANLRGTLHLLLAQATWATLNQKPQIYQVSLTEALKLIKAHYIQTSTKTKSVISALQQLQTENVKPDYPDISSSLDAIKQIMAKRQ